MNVDRKYKRHIESLWSHVRSPGNAQIQLETVDKKRSLHDLPQTDCLESLQGLPASINRALCGQEIGW